jgi:TolA-binding protein
MNPRLITTLLIVLLAWPAGRLCAQDDAAGIAHQQFVFAYRLLQRGEDQMAIREFDDFLGRFPRDEKRGDALYYRALLARKQGQNGQAAELLKDMPAPRLVPAFAVDLLRGQVQFDLGEHAQAAAHLERISSDALDPPVRASVLYLRGLAYRGMNNLPAAAEQFQAISQFESPLRPRAMIDLARTQMSLNHHAQALQTLQAALALGDTDVSAEAARLAGDVAYQVGQHAQAVTFYRSVLIRHAGSPHFSAAVVGAMWALWQDGKHGPLLETFEQLATNLTGADRIAAWYLAGSARQQLGEHARALEVFAAVLTAAAGTELEDKLLYRTAVSHSELRQYDAMNQTLQRLMRQYPQSPLRHDAQFLLAAADARRGDVAAGAARLTAIIDAGAEHPYYLQALVQRARLYEAHQHWPAAAEDYQRFVQAAAAAERPLGAAYDQAALRLIDLNYRLDNFEAADQAARRLLERAGLDPLVEQEALFRQALALVKLRRHEDALHAFHALLSRHPQNRHQAEAHYYRGLLLMTMNRPDDAIADLAVAAGAAQLDSTLRANALRLSAIRQRERQQHQPATETLLALETLLGMSQLTSEELLFLGRQHANASPRKALSYLEPLIAGDAGDRRSDRADALLLAAQAMAALGDREGAAQALMEVVATGEGRDLMARLELARLLAQDPGHAHEALAEYAGLISAADPMVAAAATFEAAQLNLHAARERRRLNDRPAEMRHRDEAQRLLKRLVLLHTQRDASPLPELALIDLAEMALDAGNRAAAEAELDDLVARRPDAPLAAYARALRAAADNRRSEALTLLRQLQRQPEVDRRLAQRAADRISILEAGR